jgi:hypothetical protein
MRKKKRTVVAQKHKIARAFGRGSKDRAESSHGGEKDDMSDSRPGFRISRKC